MEAAYLTNAFQEIPSSVLLELLHARDWAIGPFKARRRINGNVRKFWLIPYIPVDALAPVIGCLEGQVRSLLTNYGFHDQTGEFDLSDPLPADIPGAESKAAPVRDLEDAYKIEYAIRHPAYDEVEVQAS